jgi:hypothetical protein
MQGTTEPLMQFHTLEDYSVTGFRGLSFSLCMCVCVVCIFICAVMDSRGFAISSSVTCLNNLKYFWYPLFKDYLSD